MLQSFFNGLSGMVVFSQGLNTISNNVANMNTPGFKAVNNFYRALGEDGHGIGAKLSGEYMDESAGTIRDTGRATDLAVIGEGYFIVEKDGLYQYTRNGQFVFDDDGFLKDTVSDGYVMGAGPSGNLYRIDISTMKTLPPEATTALSFSGNLSTGDDEHEIPAISVFNSLGEEVTFGLRFVNSTATNPGEWSVVVESDSGIPLWTGQLNFGLDGSVSPGSESLSITIPSAENGTAGVALDLTLTFGVPGDFSASTSFAGGTVSTLGSEIVDGRGSEGLVAASFNDKGALNLLYSNGDTEEPYTIGLAYFDNPQNLRHMGDGFYVANTLQGVSYGQPDTGIFGSIQGNSIESSNVDLVREFAEMIIAQRGYQAASHVMDVANTMIETLYQSKG
ncbi:flagellar hook-basal body complex protein [Microbulbifer sp. ALW1]|uniref:flagellar hook-basal body complex protein n=1 Tax=Microbulbifer sp. (strain ALW1) TaxID=1516059 RepID=UPI0013592F63|nr:flagellar hook-basal body complex protein [Microbulbifer sp. ALW1]